MEKLDAQVTVAQSAMRAVAEIEGLGPSNCHALISCSKSKGGHRDLARNMYVSPLYRKSVMVAEGWGLSRLSRFINESRRNRTQYVEREAV
jgi:hypothetical protein